MFCPECGKELPDGSLFCGACGTSLARNRQLSDRGASGEAGSPVHIMQSSSDRTSQVQEAVSDLRRSLKKDKRQLIRLALPALFIVVIGLLGDVGYTVFMDLNNDDSFLIPAQILGLAGPVAAVVVAYIWCREEKLSPILLAAIFFAEALFSDTVFMWIRDPIMYGLEDLLGSETVLYMILESFIVAGLFEEFSKYLIPRLLTVKSRSMTRPYHAVVIMVMSAVGFSVAENVIYIYNHNGLSTAATRCSAFFTGHLSFGILMGLIYAHALCLSSAGRDKEAKRFRILSIVIPAAFHGLYDLILSMEPGIIDTIQMIYTAVLFALLYQVTRKLSRNNRPMCTAQMMPADHHTTDHS